MITSVIAQEIDMLSEPARNHAMSLACPAPEGRAATAEWGMIIPLVSLSMRYQPLLIEASACAPPSLNNGDA
jgi:hypothetical protein